ncbi:hypothetical protein NFHSH190041_32580 [Shewanella sp. NFH-SH190041]|uniref:hypothetical protein n=1 Tax=Shewanella sp. NFH-SH190041 TaxID=2950245 RepID=UPI0021C4B9FF|nr:hypothetical protein [Shewanella sp. NFH-SH190041]BDM65806.1 hypothetical protein NFHSH190041_32580 [Shewanella sp. NFH-SH190041]
MTCLKVCAVALMLMTGWSAQAAMDDAMLQSDLKQHIEHSLQQQQQELTEQITHELHFTLGLQQLELEQQITTHVNDAPQMPPALLTQKQ